VAVAPAPRLHPNLGEVYRQKVAALADLLGHEDGAEAREMVCDLVEAILLIPKDGRLRVEIRGELAAILSLAEGAQSAKSASGGMAAGALVEQIKMVAGTRS
jgi:site-specific DNA recombinase